MRDRQSMEFSKFVEVGYDKHAVLVSNILSASSKLAIAGESVSFSAGAAGTSGVVAVNSAPIFDSTGTKIGSLADSSFSWVTGTVLTHEVEFNRNDYSSAAAFLASLSNGDYAIDYVLGNIYYKKATAGTSDTCGYSTRNNAFSGNGWNLIEGPTAMHTGASDTVADTATIIGAANANNGADQLVLSLSYTKGTEDGMYLYVRYPLTLAGATLYDMTTFTDIGGGVLVGGTAQMYRFDASIDSSIWIPINGKAFFSVYQYKVGGVASGTFTCYKELYRRS